MRSWNLKLSQNASFDDVALVLGSDGQLVAEMSNPKEANLVTAAPDMFVMLKVLQSDLRITVPHEAKMRDEIQKVIDKAEGR